MLTAVTGINWGDEGKGRVIDLLAEHADIVARYQGGNNAGHTVVTEQGKFILNLLQMCIRDRVRTPRGDRTLTRTAKSLPLAVARTGLV